jgi:carbamoylphosphate synthase large subunit
MKKKNKKELSNKAIACPNTRQQNKSKVIAYPCMIRRTRCLRGTIAFLFKI